MTSIFVRDYKNWLVCLVAVLIGLIYFFSNPNPSFYYDYTYRIGVAFLQGHLGLSIQPPAWLNEMVYFKGTYFSVFPLGSVVSMLPLSFFHFLGLIQDFPARFVDGFLAVAIFIFAYKLTALGDFDYKKQIVLAAIPLLGTWCWTNLTFGGAWQIALGFAMLGQFGALYYTLVKPNYFLAGLYFSLAFGNRTEIILVAPLFCYLIFHKLGPDRKIILKGWLKFLSTPTILLGLTLLYNFFRFESFFDFGYARIPGVLLEPWYQHGIFSLYAIPLNFYTMILQGWNYINQSPYFIPGGFGGSIFLSSPWLFLLVRSKYKHQNLAIVSVISLALLTVALWLHGNPGGWQFSYRYAMILIPWFYLLLVSSSPENLTVEEIILFGLSVLSNAYATYLYYWTKLVS